MTSRSELVNKLNTYSVFIIIIICLVSRLPQLLSDHLFLDGDECIIGLMSKHFSEGKEVPFFFYGQSYGFSFIEVLFIRIYYFFFGVTDIAIKLAMLSMWTIGVLFFYKSLALIGQSKNKIYPLLITVAFILSPAFAIWSMKARGGYLTAFLLASFVTYLLFSIKKEKSSVYYIIIGVSLVFIYQSQALWLAGLIPIVTYQISKKPSILNFAYISSGVIISIFFFNSISQDLSTFWSPTVLSFESFNIQTILSIPSKIYINYTGNYSYGDITEPIFIIKVLATLLTLLTIGLVVTAIYYLSSKKQINPLFYITILSILFTVGYLTLMDGNNPRYLLPLGGFFFIAFFILIDNLPYNTLIIIVLGAVIALGSISLYDFKNFNPKDKEPLIAVIKELEDQKIQFVFCEGGLLQWELMFYSKEKIIARFKSNVDRYPAYIEQVNYAMKNTPNSTAMVGYYDMFLVNDHDNISNFKNAFHIYIHPSTEILNERGFNLEEPK